MASQEPSPRTVISGYESVFGKAKGMVFPRIVLVGHGVLEELATTCRQFGFPRRGAVVTVAVEVRLLDETCLAGPERSAS